MWCWVVVVDESGSTALQSSIQKFLHSWYNLHVQLPPTVSYQAQRQCRILCPTWTLRWHSNADKQSRQIKSHLIEWNWHLLPYTWQEWMCFLPQGWGPRSQLHSRLSFVREGIICFPSQLPCEKIWPILIKQTDHLFFLTLYMARRWSKKMDWCDNVIGNKRQKGSDSTPLLTFIQPLTSSQVPPMLAVLVSHYYHR